MKEEDKNRNYEVAEKLLSEQNFVAALIVGAVATVLSAVMYGIAAPFMGFGYGFGLAAVGVVVGFSMQYLGRGITKKFAVAASLFTIAACCLGNVFRVVMNLAKTYRVSPLEILQNYKLAEIIGQANSYVSLIDLLYLFIAVFAAVFLVMRPLSRSDRLAIGTYEMKD